MSENGSRAIHTELDAIAEALSKGKRKRVRKMLRTMHPGKVASVLEALDPELAKQTAYDE